MNSTLADSVKLNLIGEPVRYTFTDLPVIYAFFSQLQQQ